MGSTRLPGKVLRPILGRPMLWHIVNRVGRAPGISKVVVATSSLAKDAPIREFCQKEGINHFAGSESDVLDRYYQAAVLFKADPIIRITGDCPLVDPQVVGKLLVFYESGGYDHVGVATGAGAVFLDGGRYPNGLDAECFSFRALEKAYNEATLPTDREHVTPYIWRNPSLFKLGVMKSKIDYSHLRFSVDYEADFELISQIYGALYNDNEPFLLDDVIRFISTHPKLADMNKGYIGKEGYKDLWKKDIHVSE
jgi:spore coat polysaccharide biosynthesis protein SpsF